MSSPTQPTKQSSLWRGEFGDAYIDRNSLTDSRLAALTVLWSQVLRGTIGAPPRSILEVGANIGLNLRALRRLTDAEFYGVEPNQRARDVLVEDGVVESSRALAGVSASIGLADATVDLVFTSGVLIHIHPDDLLASCREIHRVARRYIACVEYFSDTPVEIPYRGRSEALFKRDFGGFYLEHFPRLRVLDYGFAWKPLTGLDNLTWWLFEKPG